MERGAEEEKADESEEVDAAPAVAVTHDSNNDRSLASREVGAVVQSGVGGGAQKLGLTLAAAILIWWACEVGVKAAKRARATQ